MQHILSLSYGKDSLACIEAVKQLDLPLDRIIHAEVWATDTIPADLPPMVEFKKKADAIIKERYGITVEHVAAAITPPHGEKRELLSYERCFYKKFTRSKHKERNGRVHGFPYTLGPWCNSDLKVQVLNSVAKGNIRGLVLQDSQKWEECRQDQRLCRDCQNGTRAMVHERTEGCAGTFNTPPRTQKTDSTIVQYLGIAADEPERIKRHTKTGIVLPLVEIGWDESYCRKWCEENDLLSPIYTTSARGGCWFCHNQSVN